MATMNEIDSATKTYADKRRVLKERIAEYEKAVSAARRKYLPGIKRAAESASRQKAELEALIEASPEHFRKPRTLILHSIRVGIMKQKGKLKWVNESQVIKLIKKLYADGWDAYIKTTEKPIRKALEQLPVSELKRLGVQVTEDTDEVVVKSTDSEIDKLVEALLRESKSIEDAA
jgi:hypothetical protein